MQSTHRPGQPLVSRGLSLAGLALVIVACSGKALDKELIVDTSHAEADDPGAAPPPPSADASRPPATPGEPPRPPDSGVKPALPPPSECDPSACGLPSGDGLSIVLVGDPKVECPSHFTTADVVEDPVAKPGACSCGSCSAMVNCNAGPITTFYDEEERKCSERGRSLRANGGACDDQGGRLGAHVRVVAPRAVVGECTALGVATRDAVATKQTRTCTPKRAACDRACEAPAGMQACVMKDGDVECPSSAPRKHLVGADFTVECANCGCEVDATCDGKMRFYERKRCHGSPTERLRAGECAETDGDEFASTRWQGTIGAVKCRKEAPPPPSVGLEETKTVCCPSA